MMSFGDRPNCGKCEGYGCSCTAADKDGAYIEHLLALIEQLEAANEALKAERADIIATKREQLSRLEARQYKLAYAIAGGEDAHGLLDSIPTEDLCDMIHKERAQASEWNEATAKLARNDALREAASMLEPTNPRDDWTRYARDCHAHAEAVLALITEKPS